jgi:hypothetical protein
MPIRPVAIGLVLCDLVVIEENTRHVTAVNCFSRRVNDGEVGGLLPFYALATLAGGHGDMTARFVIERLDTLEVTFERQFQLSFANALEEVRATFRVRANAIPVYGYYQAMLFVEGETIASRRFSVHSKGSKP